MTLAFDSPLHIDVTCTKPNNASMTCDPSNEIDGFDRPLRFDSYLRSQIWGGRDLARIIGRKLPDNRDYGEAWDISDLPLHVSSICDGPLQGMTLRQIWQHHRTRLAGWRQTAPDRFPVLVKWLDCRQMLSLQVHPEDEMAQTVLGEPNGKSEIWVIIHTEPSARIYIGLKPGVTLQDFRCCLNNGTVTDCLNTFIPRAGDCFSIPAGTIHAAGNGLVMAEIQQSSDTTFRLHDWNRVGPDGKPRQLHTESAFRAMKPEQTDMNPVVPQMLRCNENEIVVELLVEFPHFRVERHHVRRLSSVSHKGEFTIWMVVAGPIVLQSGSDNTPLDVGDTVCLPARAAEHFWVPRGDRPSQLLCIRI
jgi:mannose-6-phosphate isomerase